MFDQNKLLCFGANHITKHDKEKTQKPIMTENSSRRYLKPLVEYMVFLSHHLFFLYQNDTRARLI